MAFDLDLLTEAEYVLRLMKDKEKIESELKALEELQNNIPEPYPRTEIVVSQIRHITEKRIYLRNKHAELMDEIPRGLRRIRILLAGYDDIAVARRDTQEPVTQEPFARVNLVTYGSPADMAGIKVDDQIIKFGSIESRNFKGLTDIETLVQNSAYKTLYITVKRRSDVIVFLVKPRPWAGKGLLGCNVIPLEAVEL